jgi:hypothetical protein
MNHIVLLLVTALFATACGASDSSGPDDNPDVLAAAILELITEDHTFGDGPPPFTDYLIQSKFDPFAGTPTGTEEANPRLLTVEEQAAIESAVGGYGEVQWIDDPDVFRTTDLMPTIEGAVILGVGEPVFDGDDALVPVSLWCGGLCGTWLTYKLSLTDTGWVVTGIEGPIAVS